MKNNDSTRYNIMNDKSFPEVIVTETIDSFN